MIGNLLRKSVQLVPWRLRERIKYLPLIAPVQRFMVNRLMGNGPFLHMINAGPAKGLRVSIQMPDDKGMWTGTYEARFAEALAAAVRPGDKCFDIGGYHGFFSGVFALAGASEVHIFEPLPSNVIRIQSLSEANPKLPLVVHPVAVGAEVGQTGFVIMPEASMGKFSNSSFQQQQRGAETIAVRVETLDHLIETDAVPVPDVVKIDVEGAEAMVLAGGERMLRKRRPQLFIEVHSRELARECDDVLRDYGYGVRVLETDKPPDFESQPTVCHFFACADNELPHS